MTVFELTLLGLGLICIGLVVLWLSRRKERVDLSFLPKDMPKDYVDKENFQSIEKIDYHITVDSG